MYYEWPPSVFVKHIYYTSTRSLATRVRLSFLGGVNKGKINWKGRLLFGRLFVESIDLNHAPLCSWLHALPLSQRRPQRPVLHVSTPIVSMPRLRSRGTARVAPAPALSTNRAHHASSSQRQSGCDGWLGRLAATLLQFSRSFSTGPAVQCSAYTDSLLLEVNLGGRQRT